MALKFQIIDHGCDGEQYFPGCGVAFTDYTDVVTGIGTSAYEAAHDALDSFYQTTGSEGLGSRDMAALDAACEEMSRAESFDSNDPEISTEWHHYVSIRWAVVPNEPSEEG